MADVTQPELPKGTPEDVRRFVACEVDLLLLKPGALPWTTLDVAPNVTFEEAPGQDDVVNVKVAVWGETVSVRLSVDGGNLVVDTSSWPAGLEGKDTADDWVRQLNGWLKARDRKFGSIGMWNEHLALNKRPILLPPPDLSSWHEPPYRSDNDGWRMDPKSPFRAFNVNTGRYAHHDGLTDTWLDVDTGHKITYLYDPRPITYGSSSQGAGEVKPLVVKTDHGTILWEPPAGWDAPPAGWRLDPANPFRAVNIETGRHARHDGWTGKWVDDTGGRVITDGGPSNGGPGQVAPPPTGGDATGGTIFSGDVAGSGGPGAPAGPLIVDDTPPPAGAASSAGRSSWSRGRWLAAAGAIAVAAGVGVFALNLSGGEHSTTPGPTPPSPIVAFTAADGLRWIDVGSRLPGVVPEGSPVWNITDPNDPRVAFDKPLFTGFTARVRQGYVRRTADPTNPGISTTNYGLSVYVFQTSDDATRFLTGYERRAPTLGFTETGRFGGDGFIMQKPSLVDLLWQLRTNQPNNQAVLRNVVLRVNAGGLLTDPEAAAAHAAMVIADLIDSNAGGTSARPIGAAATEAQISDFLSTLAANTHTSAGVDGALATLNPAVIDRYGREACRAFLAGATDPTDAFTLIDVGAPAPYDYTSDGKTTTVANTYPVTVRHTHHGQTTDETVHVAGGTDGSLSWFTRC